MSAETATAKGDKCANCPECIFLTLKTEERVAKRRARAQRLQAMSDFYVQASRENLLDPYEEALVQIDTFLQRWEAEEVSPEEIEEGIHYFAVLYNGSLRNLVEGPEARSSAITGMSSLKSIRGRLGDYLTSNPHALGAIQREHDWEDRQASADKIGDEATQSEMEERRRFAQRVETIKGNCKTGPIEGRRFILFGKKVLRCASKSGRPYFLKHTSELPQ